MTFGEAHEFYDLFHSSDNEMRLTEKTLMKYLQSLDDICLVTIPLSHGGCMGSGMGT